MNRLIDRVNYLVPAAFFSCSGDDYSTLVWADERTEPTEAELLAVTDEQLNAPTDSDLKLIGVEYAGVMCSATAEDQHGLADVENFVLGGNDVNFHFENGTILTLTSANWEAFRAVWVPFRFSFFQ